MLYKYIWLEQISFYSFLSLNAYSDTVALHFKTFIQLFGYVRIELPKTDIIQNANPYIWILKSTWNSLE